MSKFWNNKYRPPSAWLILHAHRRLTVATGISWIVGKLAGWLALSETIVWVCVTPTTLGSEQERVYVSVCVQQQYNSLVKDPIFTQESKNKKLLPYKALCGEHAELVCVPSLSSWQQSLMLFPQRQGRAWGDCWISHIRTFEICREIQKSVTESKQNPILAENSVLMHEPVMFSGFASASCTLALIYVTTGLFLKLTLWKSIT